MCLSPPVPVVPCKPVVSGASGISADEETTRVRPRDPHRRLRSFIEYEEILCYTFYSTSPKTPVFK